MADVEDVRRRLEEIAEELSDMAIDRLKESISEGGTELPAEERRLTRARRAVQKAVDVLSDGGDGDSW